MIESEKFYIERDAVIALHNELADELDVDKTRLKDLKEGKTQEEMHEDPNLNFIQGRVIGFEMALNGLHAFLISQGAEASGQLTELLTGE